ncbi:hypothetical protein C8J57DRAFT_1541585 [Mycena rebaudengoi]|nr:hypothetical protein C8J57DRAFT_1541585 [Mycena rebaudengoi]
MKLAFVASFLATVQLALAQNFHWRLYNNGGCDHNSPASATFPPAPAPARNGTVTECVTTPQGILWNKLEVDHTDLAIFTFSNAACTGQVVDNEGVTCNSICPGCTIGSFIAWIPAIFFFSA